MSRGSASAEDRAGVVALDRRVVGRDGSIPVRDYVPPAGVPTRRQVVWLHGGGFSNGGLDQRESDAPARAWASAGHPVRAVDYRLARRAPFARGARLAALPNRFPAALHDVLDATLDLMRDGTPVVLGGASAGACLAAAATRRLRDGEGGADGAGPVALVLAYGTFHAELPVDPVVEAELHGPARLFFRPPMVRSMNLNYVGRADLLVPGDAFPGGSDLSGFPPTLLLGAENDRLRASGRAFAGELAAAGVPVHSETVAKTVHGFLDNPGRPAFATAVARVVAWLDELPG